MVHCFNCITFGTMGDLGEPLDILDESDYDQWVMYLFVTIRPVSKFNSLAIHHSLFRLVKSLFPEASEHTKAEYFQYSVGLVSKRVQYGLTPEELNSNSTMGPILRS
ncbi:hypothetical protein C7974DRAFT_92769 [Boeremia exigua]|uniref:uncharacterized protein n=1 Tax=Boeremia exigua TaxID=749465 RepID=UPI001E8E7B9A|nr:uncharacterized protein C7974DRAFT_92769 [Boeremia exigua]KAH6641947.1 hypothetical protein C7974DRAFT_92769 [Boeremia exigua]